MTNNQLTEFAERKVKHLTQAIGQSAFTSIRIELENELALAKFALSAPQEHRKAALGPEDKKYWYFISARSSDGEFLSMEICLDGPWTKGTSMEIMKYLKTEKGVREVVITSMTPIAAPQPMDDAERKGLQGYRKVEPPTPLASTKACCNCHSYNQQSEGAPNITLTVPRNIRHYTDGRKKVCIDACIADVIQALWDRNLPTLNSCCGHNELPSSIVIPEAFAPERYLNALREIDPFRVWIVTRHEYARVGYSTHEHNISLSTCAITPEYIYNLQRDLHLPLRGAEVQVND